MAYDMRYCDALFYENTAEIVELAIEQPLIKICLLSKEAYFL